MVYRLNSTSIAAFVLSLSVGAGSALAMPPAGVGAAQPIVGAVRSAITPGLVGNTVQAGVPNVRVGATNGLIGPRGTPTTVVGVSAFQSTDQPQGSLVTAGVANSPSSLLTLRATPQ